MEKSMKVTLSVSGENLDSIVVDKFPSVKASTSSETSNDFFHEKLEFSQSETENHSVTVEEVRKKGVRDEIEVVNLQEDLEKNRNQRLVSSRARSTDADWLSRLKRYCGDHLCSIIRIILLTLGACFMIIVTLTKIA
uniref:AsIV-cont00119-ORF1 n=1 Tax=Apophua simplicipes ichnovirus TaxID=1329648 RepID=S5DT46_9VIRU|nr:AsIV-cont00119-ORF1 [Apophua simplicipes ichnovirus]